ncbi:MAG: hypothetical protein V4754_12295 [Pseudomonadota bacterium]
MLVTLEDWILFSPVVQKKFNNLVETKFPENNLSLVLLKRFPLTVLSCKEFEEFAVVLRSTGIAYFFDKRFDKKYENWMVDGILSEAFPNVPRFDHTIYEARWKHFSALITKNWKPQIREKFLQSSLYQP